MAERVDSIHRSTGAYGQEPYDKQPKQFNHKKTEHKLNKKFNNDGNPARKKEQRKKGACCTCGSEGHMAKLPKQEGQRKEEGQERSIIQSSNRTPRI